MKLQVLQGPVARVDMLIGTICLVLAVKLLQLFDHRVRR